MAIAIALVAVLVAAPAVLAAPPLQFSEVGVRAGLGREHPGAISAPPHAPGGVAGDFDGDGAQDLFYATGGGAPDRLFINRRDGTFVDRAVPAGLARVHRAHGAAAADFDGDGALDLFIPSAGPEEPGLPPPGHLLLYRGNGDGTFTCCAPYRDPDGRLDRGAGGMAAAFGDYDLDGDLDLFVGNWASGIRGNVLFRNDGDGGFTEVGARAGVADDLVIAFAAQFVDLNGDRYPELIVTGDFGSSRYYRNEGDGTFTDRTISSGTGREANGMGSAVADLNGDGRLDWYVTSVSTRWPIDRTPGTGNALYLNAGADRFDEVARPAQVRDGGWGWGVEAVDLDHDGLRDLVTTTGWIAPNGADLYEWEDQPAFLFRNTGIDASGGAGVRARRGRLGRAAAPPARPRADHAGLRRGRRPRYRHLQLRRAAVPVPQRPGRPGRSERHRGRRLAARVPGSAARLGAGPARLGRRGVGGRRRSHAECPDRRRRLLRRLRAVRALRAGRGGERR